MINKRIEVLKYLCYIVVFCLVPTFLQGQQKEDKTKHKPNYLEMGNNFNIGLSGGIYNAYEFLDHQEDMGAEENTPSSEKSGFKLSRAYFTLKGKAKSGAYQGWSFHITTDIRSAAKEADGCGADDVCEQDNSYNLFLKYAFVSIPLYSLNLGEKNLLRLGLQHNPLVDGKAGASLQRYWGNRYVAQASTEELGVGSYADRGIAFIHENDYSGLHLLLANGEGGRRNNAQTKVSSIQMLRNGEQDSTAMDLYGLLSFIPTGKAEVFHLSINFPFRVHNVGEISKKDVMLEDTSSGTSRMLEGDRRALRDLDYGVETDVQTKFGALALTLGLGSLYKKDLRGPVLDAQTKQLVEDARDASGFGNYAFVNLRWAWIGAFYRYSYGSAVSQADGKIEAIEKGRDKGDGRFHRRIYGLSFFPAAGNSFRIAIGVADLIAHRDENAGGTVRKDRQAFIRTAFVF